MNLENSKIRAKDINLNTLSNIASKDNKTFYYNAGGGGLASISDVNVNKFRTANLNLAPFAIFVGATHIVVGLQVTKRQFTPINVF